MIGRTNQPHGGLEFWPRQGKSGTVCSCSHTFDTEHAVKSPIQNSPALVSFCYNPYLPSPAEVAARWRPGRCGATACNLSRHFGTFWPKSFHCVVCFLHAALAPQTDAPQEINFQSWLKQKSHSPRFFCFCFFSADRNVPG